MFTDGIVSILSSRLTESLLKPLAKFVARTIKKMASVVSKEIPTTDQVRLQIIYPYGMNFG
jgi:hypothetical protein